MWLLSVYTRFFPLTVTGLWGTIHSAVREYIPFVCSCMEQIELELGARKKTVAHALEVLRSHVPLRVAFGGLL